MSHPYDPKIKHEFNKEVYIGSKQITNVTMLFTMPALSEEIWDLFVTKYMIPQNGFEVEMRLSGSGNMKSTRWGVDIRIFADCMVKTNTSKFVLANDTFMPLSDGIVGNSWPPRLYHYQAFPIHSSHCNYSFTSLKYIVE